jgi:hypothetical protein
MTIGDNEIAEAWHEVNRTYCASIGDQSLPAWKDAPDWQQKSAIAAALFEL